MWPVTVGRVGPEPLYTIDLRIFSVRGKFVFLTLKEKGVFGDGCHGWNVEPSWVLKTVMWNALHSRGLYRCTGQPRKAERGKKNEIYQSEDRLEVQPC